MDTVTKKTAQTVSTQTLSLLNTIRFGIHRKTPCKNFSFLNKYKYISK